MDWEEAWSAILALDIQGSWEVSGKETQKEMISSPSDIGISRCETRVATGNHEAKQPEDMTNDLKMADKKDEKNLDHF